MREIQRRAEEELALCLVTEAGVLRRDPLLPPPPPSQSQPPPQQQQPQQQQQQQQQQRGRRLLRAGHHACAAAAMREVAQLLGAATADRAPFGDCRSWLARMLCGLALKATNGPPRTYLRELTAAAAAAAEAGALRSEGGKRCAAQAMHALAAAQYELLLQVGLPHRSIPRPFSACAAGGPPKLALTRNAHPRHRHLRALYRRGAARTTTRQRSSRCSAPPVFAPRRWPPSGISLTKCR